MTSPRTWRPGDVRRFLVKRLAASVLVAAGLLSLAAPAAAEVRRYALLVGANKGFAHERELMFAEGDATKLANLLQKLGGVRPNHLLLLAGPTADEVREAIVDLNLTIKRDLRGTRDQALLFVFYTGHGDAASLHLGSSRLAIEELSKLVRLSDAGLKVLVLDSCRSGGLTRVKGGRQVAPFSIRSEENLQSEGYAFITSSASGEDAQESEQLQSSIFTHYFLSGLRGVGDTNKDGRVTLGEAYAYAYGQTLRESMTTTGGLQHATFKYDLRGRHDPILTDISDPKDQAVLTLARRGDYLLVNDKTKSIVLEANTSEPGIKVVVPKGAYQILMRRTDSLHESRITLKGGDRRTLNATAMNEVRVSQVVRKGGTSRRLAQGPGVAAMVHGPLLENYSTMVGAQMSYALELPQFSLMPRVGIQSGSSLRLGENVLANDVRELSFEVAALHAFDFGRLAVAPLASLGLGVIHQRVLRREPCEASACAITTDPKAAILSLGLWASYPLPFGFSLDAGAELTQFVMKVQGEEDNSTLAFWKGSEIQGIVTWRATAGVGYRF